MKKQVPNRSNRRQDGRMRAPVLPLDPDEPLDEAPAYLVTDLDDIEDVLSAIDVPRHE
jgi:hypothetical protein